MIQNPGFIGKSCATHTFSLALKRDLQLLRSIPHHFGGSSQAIQGEIRPFQQNSLKFHKTRKERNFCIRELTDGHIRAPRGNPSGLGTS